MALTFKRAVTNPKCICLLMEGYRRRLEFCLLTGCLHLILEASLSPGLSPLYNVVVSAPTAVTQWSRDSSELTFRAYM